MSLIVLEAIEIKSSAHKPKNSFYILAGIALIVSLIAGLVLMKVVLEIGVFWIATFIYTALKMTVPSGLESKFNKCQKSLTTTIIDVIFTIGFVVYGAYVMY